MGRIGVSATRDSTVISVPARGFNQFTVFWVAGAGFGLLMVGDLYQTDLLVCLMALVVVAVCLVNLLISFVASTTLTVTEGSVDVRQRRLLGARKWGWRREDVTEVGVELSQLSVNKQRLPHLVITTRSGRATFMLGWPKCDLDYAAMQIREALHK